MSPDDVGLQLLENAAATAGGLVALILAFGPVSGAYFNPAVSLADAFFGGLERRDLPAYIAAQIAGAVSGAIVAHLMFDLDAVSWSTHPRSSGGLWLAEVVATVGLLMAIFGVVRSGRATAASFAVGAYFFPSSVPGFVLCQLVGGAVAVALIRILYPDIEAVADNVVPHIEGTP
jgi:arsenate reductase